MSCGGKNKGVMFRVGDEEKGLEWRLRRNLEEEIRGRCCRNNVRVMLTGEEKIRVKRYHF